MAHDDRILEQAAAWAVRTGDPSFEDWDGFTAWLESDPAHAAAYDAVASAALDGAEQLPAEPEAAPIPANDREPAEHRLRVRRIGGMVAVAAGIAAAIGLWQVQGGSAYAVETAPGETRVIALADGGQVALGGGTRLVLDRKDPGFAELEHGQALFTVRHDPSRRFRVEVGADTLVDIGTVFDVKHEGGQLSVAVAEGAVMLNPDRQKLRISPGQMLSRRTGSGEYRLSDIPAAQVGEWREGRLTFRDETLDAVAGDLSRATGIAFTVAPGLAGRRISGSVLVAPLRADPRSIGPLLGVALRPEGDGWTIEAR